MYKVKTTEWDLTEDEQEKASYILEYIERQQKLQSRGQPIDQDIFAAFNYFKLVFYHDVAARVGVHLVKLGEIISGPGYYAHMNLSKDGMKIIGYRVEKEEL